MSSLPRSLKVLFVSLAALLTLAVVGAFVVGGAYLYFGPQLPAPGEIGEARLNEPLRIYTADGRLIGEFGAERRQPVTYDQIPRRVIDAFLAAEDDRFFQHPGVDYQGLLRAAWHVAVTGRKTQGGSTITMQLARNLFLSSDRTYVRKIKEIFLALRMEAALSKEQILELYLNKIYLGNRAYGVGAAAEVYFRKPLDELTISEVAVLAGLPKAPSYYNPAQYPARARERRDYVLRRMHELDLIDREQYREMLAAPVDVAAHVADKRYEADYVAEMVRKDAIDRFGDAVYTDGYEVITTIDSERQRAANRGLRRALLAYDRRHGWRGAEAAVDEDALDDPEALDTVLARRPEAGGLVPAVALEVEDERARLYTEHYGIVEIALEDVAAAWLEPPEEEAADPAGPRTLADLLAAGDVVRLAPELEADEAASETAGIEALDEEDPDPEIQSWSLAQIPAVQGALVAVNPADGAIQAMAGGFDFDLSKFNRATQARRQPGSAFKPFLYSAALSSGFTPASIINDAPVVFDAPGLSNDWRPENYSGRIHGPTRLREGLVYSRNLVSIRLLRSVGIDTAIDHISRFGLPAERMPRDLSLSLGSATFSPLQMARAYAVFANGGFLVEPYYIVEIRNGEGQVVYTAQPHNACGNDCAGADRPFAERVVPAQDAYLMNSMMRDVIRRGTGRMALRLGRSDIAGKTGTTNEQRDAWFSGFNHDLVAISWVGFDRLDPLGAGETGARAALPMWIDFMGSALAGMPERTMPRPPGLVTVRIDAGTGKLAGGGSDGVFETFRDDNVPQERVRYDDSGSGADRGDQVERLF